MLQVVPAITVDLTWPEVLLAASVGVMRRVNAVRHAREEPYGRRPRASWTDDINGAIAELAVAKHYKVFWTGTVGRIDLPDVGVLQVRSKVDPEHRLVILARDLGKGGIFVSVLVDLPQCRLCGWLTPGEVRPEWILPDPPKPDRYFVPNAELHAMEEIGL